MFHRQNLSLKNAFLPDNSLLDEFIHIWLIETKVYWLFKIKGDQKLYLGYLRKPIKNMFVSMLELKKTKNKI